VPAQGIFQCSPVQALAALAELKFDLQHLALFIAEQFADQEVFLTVLRLYCRPFGQQ
jgi:hypothetical protein